MRESDLPTHQECILCKKQVPVEKGHLYGKQGLFTQISEARFICDRCAKGRNDRYVLLIILTMILGAMLYYVLGGSLF